MTDVFALRQRLDAARLARDTARAERDDAETTRRRVLHWLASGPTEFPHGHGPDTYLDQVTTAAKDHETRLGETTADFRAVRERLARHLDRERPLFDRRTDDPIALLPVRLETRFAGRRRLKVRVYPDDLHLNTLDKALTRAERRAAEAYWKQPDDDAWQLLLDRLSPSRAAWAAHVTRGEGRPELRRPGQRRPPRIHALPSRWRFLGIEAGRTVVDRLGRPIPLPLPAGILEVDRQADADDADPDALGAATWLVDFRAAVAVGMAVTLTLPEGVDGLDQLFVVGVQDAPRRDSTERLHDTLRAHAFTSGLAFLAPGTPTNNTPQSRADWSSRQRPPRPRPRPPELAPDTDAHRLATACGFQAGDFLAYCRGADRDTVGPARAMAMLSWAALAGTFVQAAVSDSDVAGEGFGAQRDPAPYVILRRHVVGHVRSRGPLPTLRVGRQPYGVLPVSSLDEWEPGPGPDASPADPLVLPWLLRLRHHWRAALAPGWIPRVSDGLPADRAAVEALVRLPVAKDLVIRRVTSPVESLATFNEKDPWSPGPALSIGGIPFDSDLRWSTPSELVSNLAWTGATSPPDFAKVGERLTPDPARDRRVIGRSAEKYADAVAVLRRRLPPREYAARWLERAADGGFLNARQATIFEAFLPNQTFVPALLMLDNWSRVPGQPRGDDLTRALHLPQVVDDLARNVVEPGPHFDERRAFRRARPALERADDVLAGLRSLGEVPEGGLLPLAFEALDVLSHRWDAWATSLPIRRLHEMREAGRGGVRLGGYGWVENLRRRPAPEQLDGRGLLRSAEDGYIHAPSLHHAATAAVLRSGFLGHPGETTLAVDLSSRRVRAARWLLAGVRRGQDLGSLLGYRFERALHDADLDALIGLFRRHFPIATVPPPAAVPPGDETWERSHDAIAARNVVDGLALARDPDRAAQALHDAGVPAQVPLGLVADLADVLDAVGDLVLAESVHQLVGGNPLRAGLAADTLGRGEQVPDRFEVVRTPHRGRALTHRLLSVLPTRPTRAPGWGTDAFSRLDPRLDAWVGHLLGPAGQWRLEGSIRQGGTNTALAVSVAELGFSALGTVLLAEDRRGRLDRRLRELAEQPRGAVTLTGGWPELSAAGTAIRTLLATARSLDDQAVDDQALDADVREGADDDGEAGSDPGPPTPADLEELRERVTAFAAALGTAAARRSLDVPGPVRPLAAAARSRLGPRWLAGVTAALEKALGCAVPLAPLLRGVPLPASQPRVSAADVDGWLRLQGRIRPVAREWHELLTLGHLESGTAPALSVSQAPPGGAWVAGEVPRTDRPPARTHWVRHAPAGLPDGVPWAGWVCDEWADVLPGSDALAETKRGPRPVPAESELTGLAFHFDRPDAKAPQAVLLAVPPNPRRGWTADTLALVVKDSLELAKLRAVDLGDLPLLDDLLPLVRTGFFTPLGGVAFEFWKELAE